MKPPQADGELCISMPPHVVLPKRPVVQRGGTLHPRQSANADHQAADRATRRSAREIRLHRCERLPSHYLRNHAGIALGFQFMRQLRATGTDDATAGQHVHMIRHDVVEQTLIMRDDQR